MTCRFLIAFYLYIFSSCTGVKVDNLSQHDQLSAADNIEKPKIAARPEYKKGKIHKLFFGSKYRTLWSTPVAVEVLALEDNNLSIIKKGGGRQTKNLRVMDGEKNQYVLRSVDKNPASNLPDFLQNSFIGSLIKDQASAGHPYGPLTVKKMSEALDIYHTNPRLRLIANDPALKEYSDEFAGMLVMLEHRPDEDQSQFDYLGNSKNVVSTKNMLEDLLKENDSKINQQHYLKTRLFDMIIGDWSRHEDNWRWASYEQEKGNLYKAIPRDRDNMYFYLDGILPRISRLMFKNQYGTFESDFQNFKGLNKSGLQLDKLLLSSINGDTWEKTADTIVVFLTDEVIDEAIKDLPEEIYRKNGEWLAERIRSRRNILPSEINNYYLHLAKKPELYGTDKHEKFIITTSDGNVLVEIFKTKKNGDVKDLLFSRLFYPSETKEIKIFGLAGNDHFIIKGAGQSKIKLKIYGGAGEDNFIQKTDEKLLKVRITESIGGGNSFQIGKGIKVKEKKNPKAQSFDANGALLEYYLWD